jgi:hypothetical protein
VGNELVRSKELNGARDFLRWIATVILVVSAIGCGGGPRAARRVAAPLRAAVPRIEARVLVVNTVELPKKRGFEWLVVVTPDQLVRFGDECDRFRIFDMKNRTVTFVDTIAKTWKRASFESLVADRRKLLSTPMPAEITPATYAATANLARFSGIVARQHLLTLGGYRRELWMPSTSIAPEGLFAIAFATEPIAETYAGVMDEAFDDLMQLRGFPVLDRSEMPFNGQQYVVERRIVSVGVRSVPAAWFQIPPDYTDLTPRPKAPAVGRPAASSRPSDRSTRAAE